MRSVRYLSERVFHSSISLKGFEFNCLADEWVLDKQTVINLLFLDEYTESTRNGLIEVLSYYAESYSPSYIKKICETLKKFTNVVGERRFKVYGLLEFKRKLSESNNYSDKEYLSIIRCILKQVDYLGIEGVVDPSIIELISEWKIGGNDKGIPVLSLDPEKGPYSDLEFENISVRSSLLFSKGDLFLREYCLILLFMASGRRSVQIASLKCKDFFYSKEYTGEKIYIGKIPRAKIKNSGFRASFTPFAFSNSIGQVVEMHIEDQVNYIEKSLRKKLTDEEKKELPIFIDREVISIMRNLTKKERIKFIESEISHMTSRNVAMLLKHSINKLQIISERTGRLLNSTSYRFRYTIGTRAAREGAGILTIAKLLDHSDTQNTGVYVRNIPEHAIEISKIMSQPLARFATAFEGNLVTNEEEANSINKTTARIPFREADCDIGSCGTTTFCQDYAPVACYLCPQFMPWQDAPHQKVLNFLLEERERLKQASNNDMQIVAINDRAILAVKQVIDLCKDLENEEYSKF